MNTKINNKKISELMKHKNIKVVSIDTENMLYTCDDDKSKNIWRLQGQQSDNTTETHYINNDCIPSSWKIIENSPEWKKTVSRL